MGRAAAGAARGGDVVKKIFLGLVGGLVVYELVTLSNKHEGDTISEIMWDATTKRPLVPFAFGVLCGHFFWQRSSSPAAGMTPAKLAEPAPLTATGAGVSSPFAAV
jgi:hypothetical protein